ncbi:MAG: glutamate-5-semialdehyde dehydrogenase, partial [Patescibacteria group bacterium]
AGIGEIIEERTDKNKLFLKKVRTPLGVIAVIYEARPEVTIDVAALCIKSGNAVILKGGSQALETNKTLYACILAALEKTGIDKETVSFISSNSRRTINWLLKKNEYVDLVIARGGYGLVKAVLNQSTIPVLAHAAGGARIYIDASADLSMAEEIILNAKTSKPATCNSLDTIVVHRNIVNKFIDRITNVLEMQHVKVINDQKATEKVWNTEFLGLTVAIKVVKDVKEAVNFINRHSKRHSEGVVAEDKKVIDYFVDSIDAAALFVNCSTRLHDGYVFGLGSEMGISTGKLHARGPVGLKELTTYKWEMYGNGQIRK